MEHLGPAWAAALSAVAGEARQDGEPAELVVRVVVDGDAAGAPVALRAEVGSGWYVVDVEAASRPEPALVAHLDRATADALWAGRLTPQQAFRSGRLRVHGDVSAVVRLAASLGGAAARASAVGRRPAAGAARHEAFA